MTTEPARTLDPILIDLAGLPEPIIKSIKQLVDSLREEMPSEETTQGTRDRPPLRGRFADLKLSVPREDIDEARRDAWKNFPREFPESDHP